MKIHQVSAWTASFLLVTTLLTSCEKNLEQAALTHPPTNAKSDIGGILKKGMFRGIPVTYEEKNGKAILEGDILLSKEDLTPVEDGKGDANARVKGAGIVDHNHKWPNWTIPYLITLNFNGAKINDAIKHWESNTPIRFVPYTGQKDYVVFGLGNDNSSFIGRQGGGQLITLTEDCSMRNVIHEIGHAVGLYHEHSRRDRDDYITIYWENIKPDDSIKEKFNRWPIDQGFDYGSFDYNSVMMYRYDAFSRNGQPTIVRKDGKSWTYGQWLSSDDIRTVISMYSNMYFVMGDKLSAVNEQTGSKAILSEGWIGTSKTMILDDQYIWAIQGGVLWKANRYNGSYGQVGNDDWTGAIGITSQDPQRNFYAVYNSKLYKVNKYGQRTALSQWPGAQTLYYHNNSLYMIANNGLYKVNTTTGQIERNYNGVTWYDVRGIAAVNQNSDKIYVMRKDALFQINTITGSILGGENFIDVKAMTSRNGYLYIVSGSDLIKMGENGQKQKLAGAFGTTTSVSAY